MKTGIGGQGKHPTPPLKPVPPIAAIDEVGEGGGERAINYYALQLHFASAEGETIGAIKMGAIGRDNEEEGSSQ